jgi:hypothetical protein
LINALAGNRSVNTVEHATIQEAVFFVDPTDTPMDWLDSDHVVCVYCRSMSVPRLYKLRVIQFLQGSYQSVVSSRSESRRILIPRFQIDWQRNSKKTPKWFELIISVLRSVDRTRLVKTEKSNACATVNWKMCKSVIALYLSVINRTCNQGANKSNHPNQNPLFVTRTALHVTILTKISRCLSIDKFPSIMSDFFNLALQPQWAYAHLHETVRFTSVFS